jgi:3-oxoacyl-[acyl-carrier-protein] synthase-3
MYVPERVMTNDDLCAMVDTSDEWIRTRTGILERHIASDGEATAAMAIAAGRAALQEADADPRDIGLIIVATATADHLMPSTACMVQNALSATHAGAFDLNAGCTGFVYALILGHQAILSEEHDLVLVIGADTLSRVTDWTDRSTCVLFGDGAGAVLLRASEGGGGILATLLGSDGSGAMALQIPAGGSAQPASHESVDQHLHTIRMEGREIFRFAARTVPQVIAGVAHKASLKLDDISLIIPHQANLRIIDTVAKRLKLPPELFFTNLDRYGNTSAASVPIALCEAIQAERVVEGQHLIMVGFGAGLTWAAAVLRWGVSAGRATVPFYHTWLRNLLYRWAALRTGAGHVRHRMVLWLIRLFQGSPSNDRSDRD